MSTAREPVAEGGPPLRAVEQFVYHEARLLDEQRWEEWAALFTADGIYWVPAAPDQPDPINHVSLIYEDASLRSVRIRRYRHPHAFSNQPRPRSVHLVSNVMLDSHDAQRGESVVTSRFIMLQYRRDKQDVFGGCYTHRLKAADAGFLIIEKRVDLVNCDAALESILLCL